MIRWLVTLILTIASAFALWWGYGTWQENVRLQASVESADARLAMLRSQERQLLDQKKRIEEWNDLWARAKASGIDPSHWIVNEINTNQQIGWAELSHVLSFVSSSHPQTTGMWFEPQSLRVSRADSESVEAAAAANGTEENDEVASPNPRETGEDDGQQQADLFTVRLQGRFLIPKQGWRDPRASSAPMP